MARTAVPYSNLIPNGFLADPAGVAVTAGAGNGGQIPSAGPSRSLPELTVIRCANGSGGPGTATLLAGSNPPALAAGQGNLTSGSIPTGTAGWLGPFESGRFIQGDGTLVVETSVAMTLTAFRIPRNT
jgi:hypothetical protein